MELRADVVVRSSPLPAAEWPGNAGVPAGAPSTVAGRTAAVRNEGRSAESERTDGSFGGRHSYGTSAQARMNPCDTASHRATNGRVPLPGSRATALTLHVSALAQNGGIGLPASDQEAGKLTDSVRGWHQMSRSTAAEHDYQINQTALKYLKVLHTDAHGTNCRCIEPAQGNAESLATNRLAVSASGAPAEVR